jgi:hypothetical protein
MRLVACIRDLELDRPPWALTLPVHPRRLRHVPLAACDCTLQQFPVGLKGAAVWLAWTGPLTGVLRSHAGPTVEREPVEAVGSGDQTAAADWPEQAPSLKSADALARADRPGSGQPEQEAVPNRHPLPPPLARPLHGRTVRVLHLDPVPRWPGAIRRRHPFRHDALQPILQA